MKEIKLGTIGSGIIVHHILDAVARTEGIRLEAVYSRSQEKGEALAKEIVDTWLTTEFSQGERHARRIAKLEE